MSRINGNGIAVLQDLDACTGCYACEVACREVNRYSYDEDWMRVIRRNPFVVDGNLRLYHLVAPVLDKCAECYAKDQEPLCAKGCVAGALEVGPLEEISKSMVGKHCAVFTA